MKRDGTDLAKPLGFLMWLFVAGFVSVMTLHVGSAAHHGWQHGMAALSARNETAERLHKHCTSRESPELREYLGAEQCEHAAMNAARSPWLPLQRALASALSSVHSCGPVPCSDLVSGGTIVAICAAVIIVAILLLRTSVAVPPAAYTLQHSPAEIEARRYEALPPAAVHEVESARHRSPSQWTVD